MKRKNGNGSNRNQRRVKRIFHFSTEGEITEPAYFNHLESLLKNEKNRYEFSIRIASSDSESNPDRVLENMKRHLSDTEMQAGDEAWLIVDRNSWPLEKLKNLVDWSDSDDRFNLALSNPCFEYWLVLHFERSKRNQNCKFYKDRLKKYQKNYKKKIDRNLFDLKKIQIAVDLAQEYQNAKSTNCLNDSGCTTVYRIVKKLLEEFGN